MKISKILYSLLIGISVYSLLLFQGGERGLESMRKVENYKEKLNRNLEEIKGINKELTIEFDALSEDLEMIKLKARALGYFEANEHLVNIENWNPDYNEYKPGFVIKEEYLTDLDESGFRFISLFASLLCMLVLTLGEMVLRNSRNHS